MCLFSAKNSYFWEMKKLKKENTPYVTSNYSCQTGTSNGMLVGRGPNRDSHLRPRLGPRNRQFLRLGSRASMTTRNL